MSAYKSSIFDLLSKGNLAIPDYQRPYKWTKRNIEELLTDINKAIEEGQKYGESYKYRIGTILIHNSQDGKLYESHAFAREQSRRSRELFAKVGAELALSNRLSQYVKKPEEKDS